MYLLIQLKSICVLSCVLILFFKVYCLKGTFIGSFNFVLFSLITFIYQQVAAPPPTLSGIMLLFSIQCSHFPRRSLFVIAFQFPLSGDIEKRQRMAKGAANGVRNSMFAAPFAIHRAVSYYFFQCSLFKVRYSMFAAPFAIHRAIRRSPRGSLPQSPFAGPFPIIYFPMFSIQGSLFNVRRAIHHSPLAIRHSPSHAPRHSLSLFNVP